MRMGFSFMAAPDGAAARPDRAHSQLLRPGFDNLFRRRRSGHPDAPVPMFCTSFFIQYTSHFAFSSRFTTMNESFSLWLISQPAGFAGPVTGAGGASSKPSTFANGPSKPSRMRSNCTPIWNASVQPAMSYGGIGGPPGYRKSFG